MELALTLANFWAPSIDEDAELYENENVSQPAGNDGDDVLMRLIGNA